MVNDLFAGRDPREVVPERYRPPAAAAPAMTEAERETAQEIGLMALGNLFRQMKAERG